MQALWPMELVEGHPHAQAAARMHARHGMNNRIAWPVVAALPAVTLALERAAEGADDEVVIGLRDR